MRRWMTTVSRSRTYAFAEVIAMIRPYLVARSFSGLLLTFGHLAFAVSVFWMLLTPKSTDEKTKPTLPRLGAES
jgi:cbb3-type cytochrome oxidase subunit 1